ncbi:MAG TPA: transposase [Ktedonobacteraceae bacterium]
MSETSSPIPPPTALAYVVGIDIGRESCLMCCLTMEKRQLIKPSPFSNDAVGFAWLFAQRERLKCSPQQILIGLEATSRYGENSVSDACEARLSGLPLAPRADPRICPTTRSARQNGSA